MDTTTPNRTSPRDASDLRTCADTDCTTVLSRYNPTDRCSLHQHMPARTPYLKRA